MTPAIAPLQLKKLDLFIVNVDL